VHEVGSVELAPERLGDRRRLSDLGHEKRGRMRGDLERDALSPLPLSLSAAHRNCRASLARGTCCFYHR
jgi:hypothetical protein